MISAVSGPGGPGGAGACTQRAFSVAVRVSRRNGEVPVAASVSLDNSGSHTSLTATSTPSTPSRARHARPKPPLPITS